MRDLTRLFAVTGADVVRFPLAGTAAGDAESLLHGIGAQCVAVDPADPDRVYVGTFDNGLYASHDAGRTWHSDEKGLGESRVLSLAVSPSHQASGISVVYAGTEPSNLYRSEDGGHS